MAGADRGEAPGPKPGHLGRRLRLRHQPPGSWQFLNGGVQRGISVLSFNKDHPGGARSCAREVRRTGLPGSAIETNKGRRAMNDWTGRALDELLRLRDRSAPGATAMTGARAWNRPRWPAWVSGAVGVMRRRRPGAGRSSGGLTGSKRCKKPTARWASLLRYRARAGPLPMRSCSGTRWRYTRQRDGEPPPGFSSRKVTPSQSTRPTSVAWSGTTRRWWAGPGSRAPTPGSSRRPWRSWRWTGKAWDTIPASPREFVWSSCTAARRTKKG